MKKSDELATHILQVVALIPYGKVATYGQIAQFSGLPKHARLVGYVLKHMDQANNVPWHRVINGQGKISTEQLKANGDNIQQDKLAAEQVVVVNGRINLKLYQWKP